jgi:DNA (cytosine-5)-methyltransferase 1
MRAVELFSGAGGMSRGLMEAKIEVVAAFDHEPRAIEQYNRNVGPHGHVFDLSNVLAAIDAVSQHNPDLICGGPPCQDFTAAGRRIEGARANLTVAFATVVAAVKPRWFLMENVTRALSSRSWAKARAILEKAGYGISVSKIDCARYAVPQSRRRLIVIGRIGERHGFMESAIAQMASAERMTIRDAFAPHPFDPERDYKLRGDNWQTLRAGHVFVRPYTGRRNVQTIDEPLPTITSRTDEAPTDRHRENPHPRDTLDVSTANVLSIRQRSLFQGFGARWDWGRVGKRAKMQMIANAVPGPVAKRIGKAIMAREAGRTTPEIVGNFRQWLTRKKRFRLATASNYLAACKRGRALLGGRTFDLPALEIATLEATPRYAALKSNQRSDIKRALLLYAEYLDIKAGRATLGNPWHGLDVIDVEPKPPRRAPNTLDLKAMMAKLKRASNKKDNLDLPDEDWDERSAGGAAS